jgi:hypothetical protein
MAQFLGVGVEDLFVTKLSTNEGQDVTRKRIAA